MRLSNTADDEAQGRAAIEAYTEALRLDPDYALALSGRSLALTKYVDHFVGRIGHEDRSIGDSVKLWRQPPHRNSQG